MEPKYAMRLFSMLSLLNTAEELPREVVLFLAAQWGMSVRNIMRYQKAAAETLQLLRNLGYSVHIFKEKADEQPCHPRPVIFYPVGVGWEATSETRLERVHSPVEHQSSSPAGHD